MARRSPAVLSLLGLVALLLLSACASPPALPEPTQAPPAVAAPIATAVAASPTAPAEAFPTSNSAEIFIDKAANLFASPDSRAPFQPYDSSIRVTKATITGRFGDFIRVQIDQNKTLFLPSRFVKGLPEVTDLSPDQISQWSSVADLKSKDGNNITVSDVFKVDVNLKKGEGAILTGTDGNSLSIQIEPNSQFSFQFKSGTRILKVPVDNPGHLTEGTLRIDLKGGKAAFLNRGEMPVIQLSIPIPLFPDREIQNASLDASGDSNAQILVEPDGQYVDPTKRIPTATAVPPTSEGAKVSTPTASGPNPPAKATSVSTQKTPDAPIGQNVAMIIKQTDSYDCTLRALLLNTATCPSPVTGEQSDWHNCTPTNCGSLPGGYIAPGAVGSLLNQENGWSYIALVGTNGSTKRPGLSVWVPDDTYRVIPRSEATDRCFGIPPRTPARSIATKGTRGTEVIEFSEVGRVMPWATSDWALIARVAQVSGTGDDTIVTVSIGKDKPPLPVQRATRAFDFYEGTPGTQGPPVERWLWRYIQTVPIDCVLQPGDLTLISIQLPPSITSEGDARDYLGSLSVLPPSGGFIPIR